MKSIYLAVYRLQAHIGKLLRAQLKEAGIDTIEAHVLAALYHRDEQRPTELARSVGRAATSFTPILDRLENKFLICRQPDADDRRAVTICLTENGEALRNLITDAFKSVESQMAREIYDWLPLSSEPPRGRKIFEYVSKASGE